MRKEKIVRLGLLAAAALSLRCGVRSVPAASSEREVLEKFMRNAPVVSVDKETRMGRMNAWLVTLGEPPSVRRAIFKSIRRNRPAPFPDSYAYELAAYELDRLLGLGVVPVTVEREIDGRTGSLQEFMEGVETEKSRLRKNLVPPDLQAYQDKLDVIQLFENLVCAPRMDLGDILIQTADWKAWRVDFSEAFPPEPALPPECAFHRASRRFRDALAGLKEPDIREKLKPYLNPAEMEALLGRRRALLAEIARLIGEKGEAAVLYRP